MGGALSLAPGVDWPQLPEMSRCSLVHVPFRAQSFPVPLRDEPSPDFLALMSVLSRPPL